MDLIKTIAQKIFIPLSWHREGFAIKPTWAALEESQYWPKEKLLELQWKRLAHIIDEAYRYVPYYREKFDEHGIRPEDIKSPDDIKKLPILTKQDIRENIDRMISERFRGERLIPKKTGGSTGVPLKLFWSVAATTAKKAATMRHDAWTGYRLGEKLAILWGAEAEDATLRFKIYNKLTSRRIALDTLQMDETTTMAFINRLRKFGAKFLFGHAHSLYIFALFVKEHGLTDLPTESILSTAEVLTENERAEIERVLQAPLFDRYGCEELSIVASECEAHEGMHLHAEGLWVETDGADETTPADLIITDLTNEAMPLIRYRLEDMATVLKGDCPCGRTLPRLGKLYGRHTDFLYTPDGRMLSGISIMVNLAIEIPGIWQVQVVQDKLDHLLFRIVKTDKFGEYSLKQLAEAVPQFFGRGMTYDVEYVPELSRTPRGKYQFSICQIDKPGRMI
ncbi:MAG TPA: phenylacetate--CoA ligase family protein [candidate division Zixibacteria bacterium]|nr:phenylacetate--CoA ligase family protein [candidate division Zixibacteria bacterium]